MLGWWISLRPAIDLIAQIMQLVIEGLLPNFDPPRFRAAIAAVGPTITAGFQVVLQVEGAMFGKVLTRDRWLAS